MDDVEKTKASYPCEGQNIEARIYRRPGATRPEPGILVCPGRSKEVEPDWLAYPLAKDGFVVLSMTYRGKDDVYLKTDIQGATGRLRLRNVFLVGQVALSLTLVVAAFLLLRALQRAGSVSPGFEMKHVELTSLDLSLAGYTDQSGPIFARQLITQVRTLPGVQSASLAAQIPLGGGGLGFGSLRVPGAEFDVARRRNTDWPRQKSRTRRVNSRNARWRSSRSQFSQLISLSWQ